MKKISKHIGNIVYITLCLFTMFMFIVMCGMFLSCKSNAQTIGPFEWMDQNKNISLVMFDFCNINDAHYIMDDANFYIEYNDQDAWDYDNLAYRTGRQEWYGDYIQVDLQDSLVSEFLQDWGNYAELRKNFKDNWEEMDKLSEKWGVMEIHLSDGDIRFELTKLPSNFNWWE